MLNYIWGGLILFSLIFALLYDVRDLSKDTYRNGDPLAVTLVLPSGYDESARRLEVDVTISASDFGAQYGSTIEQDLAFDGVLIQSVDGRKQLQFARDANLPSPLSTIQEITSPRDNDLRGPVEFTAATGATAIATTVTFEPVRFVKLQAITAAALDFAEVAVTLALGLIGALALWMGLLKIGEDSGMIAALVRFTQPLFRRLFPEIPDGHPATGLIMMNLTANVLGLGNAATPLGIKAMESLQTLNPQKDTATNSMVMLLAMNTASVQLVPPSLLVAIMGLQVNQLFFSILLTTALSLVIAIVVTRFLQRLRRFKSTDPGPLPANQVEDAS